MSCLLLNASWEPLRIVPLTRAINLVITRKAEVVEETERVMRAESFNMQAPLVIRLVRMVKIPYRSRVPLTRSNLVARDKGLCAYCNVHVGNKGTIDHVQPRSRKGLHRWENVVLSCSSCNSKKDAKTLSELGWKLKFEPWAPKGTSWIILGLSKTVEDSWLPYLSVPA